MSFSGHGMSMSRASQGDNSLRPILASMDNMTLGHSNANDGKPQSSVSRSYKPHPNTHHCLECSKGLHGTCFTMPNVDTVGVACRKCYTNPTTSSINRAVYCDECMHGSGDICANCHVFFCQDCLEEANRTDHNGHRYCSEQCAHKNLSPSRGDYDSALDSMGAKLSLAKQLFRSTTTTTTTTTTATENPQEPIATTTIIPLNPIPTQSLLQTPTKTPRKIQSTPQSSKRKGCAWCRQSLKSRTPGPKSEKKTVGYYCKCASRKVYCDGCAINHGDFCKGKCYKFVCRNCVPYDGWFHAEKSDGDSIYCSKQCVPDSLKSIVVRRTLFDDEDWEAEEYLRPLSRRCQAVSDTGERCKITASHPCATAKSLKRGDDFCTDHGGSNVGIVLSDDESLDDGDYYFRAH